MKNRFHNKGHQFLKQSKDDQKTIYCLKNGESAIIKDIVGGRQFINKAESLGIREGVQITKVSSQMMQGPITIKVGQTQIAIGRGMANRIIIE
ncbi:MAG: FeoA family protein [Candidatus Cloacimonetes bacterium]|jgi:ferrous iron transport protein A|nr:FeoA family protein [Candidatus Cloacimonadota bacterium]